MPALASAEQKAGLPAGRRALASAIVASGILGSHRVVVVYDASTEAAPSEPSPHPALNLRFSTPPADADREIRNLLSRARVTSTGPITVVTADDDLSWECRKLGAAVIAPESWEPFRGPRRRKMRGGAAETLEKPKASAKDVEYWLEIFGDESPQPERRAPRRASEERARTSEEASPGARAPGVGPRRTKK